MSFFTPSNWLRRQLIKKTTPVVRQSNLVKIRLESLEDRAVPAVINIVVNPNGSVTPTEGKAFPNTLIGFFDTDNYTGTPQTGQLSAEILWGDGNVSAGLSAPTIQFAGPQATPGVARYNVFGSNIYRTASTVGNPYILTLRVYDNTPFGGGQTSAQSGPINVADNALTAQANPTVTATVGAPLNNVVVARFTDANPYSSPDQLRATITWSNPSRTQAGIIVRDANGVYNVLGSHTYDPAAAAGPQPISVNVVSQDPTFGINILNNATVNQAAIAVVANPIGIVEGATTIPAATIVGSFTDFGGAQPASNYINFGTFAIFPGAAGTTPLTVTRIGTTNTYTLTTTGVTNLFTPARIGVAPYSLRVADLTGNSGVGTGSLTVNNAPMTVINVSTIAPPPTEGQPITINPLMVFNDQNLTATGADYVARINWGDDTPDTIGVVTSTGPGAFQIAGTHTYTRRTGPTVTRRVTISVTDSAGQTITGTTLPFNVLDATLTNAVALPVIGAVGQQLLNVPVATFVDPNPFAIASDYSATINWGIGGPAPTTGSFRLIGRSGAGTQWGVYTDVIFPTITGSPFNFTVNITDISGQLLQPTSTATVTQSPLTVTAFAQTGNAGLPLTPTNPFALFTDVNVTTPVAANYTATINWGDGSAPVTFGAGVGITLVSGNQLRFTPPTGYTYARPGLYPITVTINGPDGRVGVAGTSALIAAPAITPVNGGPNITTAVEGTALPASTVVATFTVANPSALPTGYVATIDWGDGTPMSIGAITLTGTTATSATFSVTAPHTYTRFNTGPLTIRTVIEDQFGGQFTANTTVTQVAGAALSTPTPIAIVGAAGQLLNNVAIGTFVDANPFATEADHNVTINWGTGPVTPGRVTLVGRNGTGTVFAVFGSTTYPSVTGSPFAVSAIVTDSGGSTVTINTTATITQSPIAVSVYAQNSAAGLPLTPSNPFALFTDANGAAAAGSYTATINWGDGSAPVTLGAGAGITLVSGNQLRFTPPNGYTYARPGLYPITVTINGPDGRVGVGSASALVSIPVIAPVAGGPNITTAVEGTALPGTTVVGTFTVANPSATAAGYTAIIDWGDGSPMSVGAIALTGTTATSASFSVTGGHTYARYNAGPLTIRVLISDVYGNTVTALTTVTQVADAALTNATPIPIVGAAGQQLADIPIGTFVDANPFATEADHAAVINWGAGGPTTIGRVTLVGRSGTGSVFVVRGTNLFPSVTGSPFAVSAVVTDLGGSTITINTTATITQSPIAVSVYGQSGSAGLLLTPTNPFALFTDANGAGPVNAYSATISWGDGSAPVVYGPGVGITLVSGNQLRFTPPTGYTYARPGLYPITVTINGPDGRAGLGSNSALIAAPVFSGVNGGPTISNAVEGTALPANTVVAVFTINNPSATPAGYSAVIDWGDGSPTSLGAVALTGTTATTASFQVTGNHTYTRYAAGPLTIRVNITDGYGTTVQATTTVTTVTDAALSGATPIAILGAAGQQLVDVPLGTFVDANPFATEADQSVVINWGAGGPSTVGRVSLVGRSGTGSVFVVRGTTVYPSVIGSPFAVSAVVTSQNTSTITINTIATITQSPISVAVYAQNGSAGLPLIPSNPFALFTDSNGVTGPGAYRATINWGDGSAPVTYGPGVGITLVSGNQLSFTPPTGYTYAIARLYPITVTIAGPDGRVGVGANSALVVPPAYPGGFVSGATINRVEGSAIPATTVLTTFTVANPGALASTFTATIDWGDGQPRSTGTVTLTGTTATTASFRVTGGHTYARPGTYPITVTIVDQYDGGGVATLNAIITNAPLVNAQPVAVTATARIPLTNVTLGLFSDQNLLGSASEYTATINWNDPQAPGADPIGLVSAVGGNATSVQFGITGSHTYSRAGTYPVTVVVTDANSQTITINTTVTVRAPILSGAVNPVIVTEGAATPANLVLASFASLGSNTATDYTVVVTWGDGGTDTAATGVTVVATGGGNFNVLVPAHTYATRGSYVMTVTITGVDGSGPFSLTNLATVLDAPLTGPASKIAANEGIAFTATPTSPLVSFTDANPGGKTAEFLASIDWGDGSSSIGQVVQPGGVGTKFVVLGTHVFQDNRTYNGTIVVTSAGGQRAIIPSTFNVANIAPIAQMTNTGPVFENSPVTVSLINGFDPSPADTAAGLRYSFALTSAGLASTYLGAGLSNSAQFTFPDGPTTQVVYGRIIDKDGGFTDYQTTVTVVNVVPTGTIAATGSYLPRQPLTVTISNVNDVSPVDTAIGFTYSFDLGDGQFTAPTKDASITFNPAVSGKLVIRGRVIDKDGGVSEYTVGGANGLNIQDRNIYAIGAGNGGAPIVKIYNTVGVLVTSFFAYDPSFRGGVNVAVGDVNGDGIPDVVTGTGVGGGPHVKVYDGRDFALIGSFMTTNPSFRGGVRVATGDVDGDGKAEIVTGAGLGGGPQVQVFTGTTFDMIQNFFAYSPTLRGGVSVAVGDVDGDGKAELVTGAGFGGAPHVRIFDAFTGTERSSFFAYETSFTGGVNVAIGDINRDGKAEIVTGPGLGGGSLLRSFDAATGDPIKSVFAFGPDRVNGKPLRNGINVAISGLTSGSGPVIVAGSGPDYSPLASIRDGRTLDELNTIFPFEDSFGGGVFVG